MSVKTIIPVAERVFFSQRSFTILSYDIYSTFGGGQMGMMNVMPYRCVKPHRCERLCVYGLDLNGVTIICDARPKFGVTRGGI